MYFAKMVQIPQCQRRTQDGRCCPAGTQTSTHECGTKWRHILDHQIEHTWMFFIRSVLRVQKLTRTLQDVRSEWTWIVSLRMMCDFVLLTSAESLYILCSPGREATVSPLGAPCLCFYQNAHMFDPIRPRSLLRSHITMGSTNVFLTSFQHPLVGQVLGMFLKGTNFDVRLVFIYNRNWSYVKPLLNGWFLVGYGCYM